MILDRVIAELNNDEISSSKRRHEPSDANKDNDLKKLYSDLQALINANTDTGILDPNNIDELKQLYVKIQKDLDAIKVSSKEYEGRVSTRRKNFEGQISHQIKNFVLPTLQDCPSDLTQIREIKNVLAKLKLQIPLPRGNTSNSDASHSNPSETSSNFKGRLEFTDLDKDESFGHGATFKSFQVLYESLDLNLRLCLLCFSVFPPNSVMKKKLLTYWWVGEGYIESTAEETAEDAADEILRKLLAKGFLQPIYKKRRLVADRFKMHPFVHSVVLRLANRVEFFDRLTKNELMSEHTKSLKACLVKPDEGSSQQEIVSDRKLNQEDIQALFNVSEPYPDLKLEWFSKMKNLTVLQLGRWKSSDKHHIEVLDAEFLKGLKNMRHLRFFSLKGIFLITRLPDSICRLSNLRILDLKACYSLEALPENIGSLKKLTHMDISECYFLDHMPKSMASLSELQVLEGFVIVDSKKTNPCNLDDLAKLEKLRKLSINTGLKDFPTYNHLRAFHKFKALRRLTIAWGGDSGETKSRPSEYGGQVKTIRTASRGSVKGGQTSDVIRLRLNIHKLIKLTATLPAELNKLDLRSFPQTKAPYWLMNKLTSLKKLSLIGGKISDLGKISNSRQGDWKVDTLRLKFLSDLEMNWKELQVLFPHLIYLEKVKCPKLTLFPCDVNGVWTNRIVEAEK